MSFFRLSYPDAWPQFITVRTCWRTVSTPLHPTAFASLAAHPKRCFSFSAALAWFQAGDEDFIQVVLILREAH
jgi:hypothetical protein